MSTDDELVFNSEDIAAMLTTNMTFRRNSDPGGTDMRNIDSSCHYPDVLSLSPQDYKEMHDKFGIANRVNSVLANECWEDSPEVYEVESEDEETKFEKAWKDLAKSLNHNSHFEDEE